MIDVRILSLDWLQTFSTCIYMHTIQCVAVPMVFLVCEVHDGAICVIGSNLCILYCDMEEQKMDAVCMSE